MSEASISVIVLALYLAIGPGIFWAWFYYQKGRAGGVPTNLLIKLFLGGCAATLGALGLETLSKNYLPSDFFNCVSGYCDTNNANVLGGLFIVTFLIIAPIEEGLKYLAIRFIAFKHQAFNQIIDGVKYGVAVGLGFATIENALYLIGGLLTADYNRLLTTLVLRFMLSTLAHTLYSGLMGYYIGRARFDALNQKSLIRRGLIYAILAHGAFNFLLFAQVGPLSIALLGLLAWIIYRQYREAKNLEIQRTVPGQANIPYLSDHVFVNKSFKTGDTAKQPDQPHEPVKGLENLRQESLYAQRPKHTLEEFLNKRKWSK